jgi:hypothetical protein
MDFVRSRPSVFILVHLLMIPVVALDRGHFPCLAGREQEVHYKQSREASGTLQEGVQSASSRSIQSEEIVVLIQAPVNMAWSFKSVERS